KPQTALNNGNYDAAINTAIENLQSNKTKKNKQPYVLMLEEAFAKAVSKDMQDIQFLERDGNPANLETIYNTYLRLNDRQERIRPLLPLPVLEENRDARFSFDNYTDEIINVKNRLSAYLYANASKMLNESNSKFDYREAHQKLQYLNTINPNYQNTVLLMDEALRKGTDFVMVNLSNETDKVIPQRLEEDLLNFNTYGINDPWVVYHNNPLDNIHYDYEMRIAFRSITISPEQVRERQLVKERQVKDGWQYLEDEKGNVVKDSVGNPIKVDKFTAVTCNFYEYTQYKSVQVQGQVSFNDLNTQQTVNTYPLTSQFVFEYVYANYSGDKRALEDNLLILLDRKSVPFPSNEQMIYDAGEDIKNHLKAIISKHRF
ncbi:MAG: hypothetical protein KDD04_08565, partial [Sinomicrobium sp.]|nr:hypothetical protein [Sinomicrobium sp.]